MAFDGLTTGDNPQYIFSTGPYQSTGSLQVIYQTAAAGAYANTVQVFWETDWNQTPGRVLTAGVYLFVLQRSGGVISLRSCAVNGSAVTTEFSNAFSKGALDGPGGAGGGLVIGGRADLTATRFLDQSIGRFFRYDGALSDAEVVRLASGEQITDLGKTAAWYLRMDDAADYADRGTQANTITPHGALAAGTAPGFSYTGTATQPPADAVDVAAPAAERIYQRSNGAAPVALTGAWSGTKPTSLEYQLYAEDGSTVAKAWASLAATINANGTWSASPSIPQGGMYRIAVRTNSGATSGAKANLFGVGDLYAWQGSSSAERAFTSDSGTGLTAVANVRVYKGGWAKFGANGSAILAANTLAQQAGVPVGFVNRGVSGTALVADWLNTGSASWSNFAGDVAGVGGKLAGVIATVGSNDAANGSVVDRPTHLQNLKTLFQRTRDLTSQQSLPIFLSGFNRRSEYSNQSGAQFAARADAVRMAENDAGDLANVYHVQILDLELSSDNVHLTPAGFQASASRLAQVMARVMYGDGVYMRGPKITSMTASGNTVTVKLAHRGSTDVTPAKGITGFTAFDANGGAVAISDASRTDATTITLTCASTPAKAQYLEGAFPPVGTPVYGNTTPTLPMTVETDLVVQQISNPAQSSPDSRGTTAMKFPERVRVVTTGVGTGSLTMAAAAVSADFRTVAASGLGVGDTFPYSIGTAGSAEWECGIATIASINNGAVTFSRNPTASSNGNALVNFSAGSKEVICTPLGATLAKWEGSTSVRVVYLSNYCVSDTDLNTYASSAGADQRAKVQAVLDLALNGPLRVVWDVAITVAQVPDGSGDTLRIRSNTEIVALNGCGARHAAGQTAWMWMNANPTTNANNNFAAIVDENITIDGGIWNGNRAAQNGVKNDVFHWSGVRNLNTRNYKVLNASGMAHRSINTDGHKNFFYEIDFGAGNAVVNTDGMHYHGPARGLRDRGGRILNCGDDAYALNADDAWGEANFTGRFDNVYGPITDVTVEDLYISSSVFAVRLLSGASRIDDIRFKNVRGSTTGYGFVIDNYLTPSKCVQPGPGNFGSIEVDGWHMTNTVHNPNADWYQMAMHINGKVEQLSLKNIVKSDFNNILFPAIRFGEKANIDQLMIDFASRNYNGGTYLTEQIDFAPGAKVTQADLRVRTFASSAVSGYPVRVQSGANIDLLTIDGQAPNFTGMLLNQGAIATLRDRTAASTVAPPVTTWALQSSTPWVEDVSNPGSLTYAGPKSGVVASAKKIAADAFSGQVKVSDSVTFTGSASFINGFHSALVVRGSSTVPWSGVQQGYFVDMFLESGGGIKINKAVAGTQSAVSSQITVPFALNVEYLRTFQAKTNTSTGVTTLTVTLQRVSDGLYLQGNGTWSSTAGPAISATDSSIPAASGEWGVYGYNEGNTSCNIVHKNISIAAAT